MITIGDTIVLESVDEVNQTRKYKSKLSDINEIENYIVIDMPIDFESEQFVFLKKGIQYKAYIYGKGDAYFSFDTSVLSFEKKNILLFQLTYPGIKGMLREQHRQFARVGVETDVAVYPLNGVEPFVAISEDISAGGIAVQASIEIEVGTMADLWITLTYRNQLIEYINVQGIVRRVIEKDRHTKVIAFEFSDLGDRERQLLIKYSLEQEMLNRIKLGV